MLDYLQIYPQTIELVKRYKEDQRCRLYEAMARYAFTGDEPDWPEDAAEWLIWEALKQTVDRADKKVNQNKQNASGKKDKETKANEPERTEAKPSEPERTEAKESESDNHKPRTINQEHQPVIHENENDFLTPPQAPAKSADGGAGFEEFWKVYPKKQDKQNALRAWKKLKPDAETQRKIMAAVRSQRDSPQWNKDGGQYIPLPSTWLNGRRWEDQAVTGLTGKRVSAQMYEQREYTEEELMAASVDIIEEVRKARALLDQEEQSGERNSAKDLPAGRKPPSASLGSGVQSKSQAV